MVGSATAEVAEENNCCGAAGAMGWDGMGWAGLCSGGAGVEVARWRLGWNEPAPTPAVRRGSSAADGWPCGCGPARQAEAWEWDAGSADLLCVGAWLALCGRAGPEVSALVWQFPTGLRFPSRAVRLAERYVCFSRTDQRLRKGKG